MRVARTAARARAVDGRASYTDADARRAARATSPIRRWPSARYLDRRELLARRGAGARVGAPRLRLPVRERGVRARACADAGLRVDRPAAGGDRADGRQGRAPRRRRGRAPACPVVPAERRRRACLPGAASRPPPAAAARGCASCDAPDELDEATAAARREAQAGVRRRPRARRALPRRARATSRSRCSPTATATACTSASASARCSAATRRWSRRRRRRSSTPRCARGWARRPSRSRRPCGYAGAGTVEFIADADDAGEFFFLEMNARLQVEHPVTELVYGPRPRRAAAARRRRRAAALGQEQLVPDGHAIEARLYAEDPAAGFLPATGTVRAYREPRPGRARRLRRARRQRGRHRLRPDAGQGDRPRARPRDRARPPRPRAGHVAIARRDDERRVPARAARPRRRARRRPWTPACSSGRSPTAAAIGRPTTSRRGRDAALPPGTRATRRALAPDGWRVTARPRVRDGARRRSASRIVGGRGDPPSTATDRRASRSTASSAATRVAVADDGGVDRRDGHHLEVRTRAHGAHAAQRPLATRSRRRCRAPCCSCHVADGDAVDRGRRAARAGVDEDGAVDHRAARRRRRRARRRASATGSRATSRWSRSSRDGDEDDVVSSRDGHLELIADLQARLERVRAGGGERARERHVARGKLLPRDRVERLLRPGRAVPRALAAGRRGALRRRRARRGHRHRRRRVSRAASASIVANDATVKGGTYYPMTVKKHLRAQEIALHNRLPCIYLVDSGGAFLPMQDEVFPDREHFGRIFFNQATMSERGDPADRLRDGLVHGRRRLRAGDERRDGDRPRAGHDLPRRPAAGEGRDRRGGHRRGARRRRRARAHLAASSTTWPTTTSTRWRSCARSSPRCAERPRRRGSAARRAEPPAVDPSDSSTSSRSTRARPTTPRELHRAASSTAASLHEFKELYGTTRRLRRSRTSTGTRSAIIANNGILFSESALKAAHFIELCDRRGDPARVPAEHHRLHGRPRLRGRRHRQGRRQDGHRRVAARACRS